MLTKKRGVDYEKNIHIKDDQKIKIKALVPNLFFV